MQQGNLQVMAQTIRALGDFDNWPGEGNSEFDAALTSLNDVD